MAVGPNIIPPLFPVAGFLLGTGSAGIKKPGRKDLVVMQLCEDSVVAGVFTKNAFCAAPVQIAKRYLKEIQPRIFLVNTGNANAGTGEQGLRDAHRCAAELAQLVGVKENQVLPFSTGVIGEPLPVEKIVAALPSAIDQLGEDGWEIAAHGIMTTDTRPKAASRQYTISGETVTITGIAKGAGMIKPNMATMLAYIATDVCIDSANLHNVLRYAVDHSFNRITVDGDTSTNDACMLVATQQSLCKINESNIDQFRDAVTEVFIDLAQGLVRDGEGASKFVTVQVCSGANEAECLQVAYTIAESPLVKTALFASDPNWGRLLAAIGRAGLKDLDVDKVSVYLNDVKIAEHGARAASYTEEQGVAVMANDEIVIRVELDRGSADTTVWTSDLSHDYVRINAEYRT